MVDIMNVVIEENPVVGILKIKLQLKGETKKLNLLRESEDQYELVG